jgi:hypothetical protein
MPCSFWAVLSTGAPQAETSDSSAALASATLDWVEESQFGGRFFVVRRI